MGEAGLARNAWTEVPLDDRHVILKGCAEQQSNTAGCTTKCLSTMERLEWRAGRLLCAGQGVAQGHNDSVPGASPRLDDRPDCSHLGHQLVRAGGGLGRVKEGGPQLARSLPWGKGLG